MVPLDEIAPFFDGFIRTETDSAVISAGGGAARLSSGRSLVRVEDKLVLLSAPVRAGGSRWFVPLDFLEKVVPALSEEKASYRGDDRILVIGEGFPRLSVRASAHPAYTRIVLESSTTIPYQVNHVGPQVQVSLQAEYLETDFQTQELRDGVVERMSLAHRAGSYVFVLELGERFGTLKAFEMNNPDRIVLDLFRSLVPADAPLDPIESQLEGPPAPRPVPPKPRAPDRPVRVDQRRRNLSIITLDPGHGGAETGATGLNGLQEKDVALSITRRLRTLLENRLGVRVVVTRDGDRDLPLDERTAIANNNKSDLFISVHTNGSARRNASGSEVYYLSYGATDEDARHVAATENASAGGFNVQLDRDLDFILWDMAQAAHLNESAVLAEMLQEELLGGKAEEKNRGIKQAPLRVLMGATMPAVLVEVGFITNPEEERLLRSADFQNRLAQAIFRGVLKYKERYERMLGARS